MDSAMLVSGSLPMSSAEIASTMLVAWRLVSIAFSMPTRIPVTVTPSSCCGGACCAKAGTAATVGSAAAIAMRRRLRERPLNSMISVPRERMTPTPLIASILVVARRRPQ